MKLRNKKTGEIVETSDCDLGIMPFNSEIRLCGYNYNSLAELCEEWTDYEEPKTHWFINTEKGGLISHYQGELYQSDKEIGNYFETKEEAEKAVEKLKAWKRLKDDGITFSLDERDGTPYIVIHSKEERGTVQKVLRVSEDLTLLFGGEE